MRPDTSQELRVAAVGQCDGVKNRHRRYSLIRRITLSSFSWIAGGSLSEFLHISELHTKSDYGDADPDLSTGKAQYEGSQGAALAEVVVMFHVKHGCAAAALVRLLGPSAGVEVRPIDFT